MQPRSTTARPRAFLLNGLRPRGAAAKMDHGRYQTALGCSAGFLGEPSCCTSNNDWPFAPIGKDGWASCTWSSSQPQIVQISKDPGGSENAMKPQAG